MLFTVSELASASSVSILRLDFLSDDRRHGIVARMLQRPRRRSRFEHGKGRKLQKVKRGNVL